VPPFTIIRGNPARWYTVNEKTMRENDARSKDIMALRRGYADIVNNFIVEIDNEYIQAVFDEWMMALMESDLGLIIGFDGMTHGTDYDLGKQRYIIP